MDNTCLSATIILYSRRTFDIHSKPSFVFYFNSSMQQLMPSGLPSHPESMVSYTQQAPVSPHASSQSKQVESKRDPKMTGLRSIARDMMEDLYPRETVLSSSLTALRQIDTLFDWQQLVCKHCLSHITSPS